MSKVKQAVEKQITREGLPKEAFAIVGDPEDPGTWKLPHHTRVIFRALQGRLDLEKTVDWDRMPAAVAALSRGGYRGERVQATPDQSLRAPGPLAATIKRPINPCPTPSEPLSSRGHMSKICHKTKNRGRQPQKSKGAKLT